VEEQRKGSLVTRSVVNSLERAKRNQEIRPNERYGGMELRWQQGLQNSIGPLEEQRQVNSLKEK
jgi:hypothetical protein